MTWRARFLELYFRNRSSALLVAALPVVVWSLRASPATVPWGVAGAAFVLAGVALRLASIRQIGRGARVHKAHATAGLVSEGPYRWSRNPLYVAAGLLLCGLGLLAGGGPAALLLLVLTVVVYTPVVVHEQGALLGLLGPDYASYSERTPMWVGLRSLLVMTRGSRSEEPPILWGEVFKREWRLVPGMVLGVAGVLLLSGRSVLVPTVPEWTLWVGAAGVLLVGGLMNAALLGRRRRRKVALREALRLAAQAEGSEAASELEPSSADASEAPRP